MQNELKLKYDHSKWQSPVESHLQREENHNGGKGDKEQSATWSFGPLLQLVCHTSDPRINGSPCPDMVYTTWCRCVDAWLENCCGTEYDEWDILVTTMSLIQARVPQRLTFYSRLSTKTSHYRAQTKVPQRHSSLKIHTVCM